MDIRSEIPSSTCSRFVLYDLLDSIPLLPATSCVILISESLSSEIYIKVVTIQISGFPCVTLYINSEVAIQRCYIIIAVIKIWETFWENLELVKLEEWMPATLLS